MARLLTTGFEINDTSGAEFMNAGGTGVSLSTTVVRSGSRSLRINGLTSGAESGIVCRYAAVSGNGPYFVRLGLRVDTAPSAANSICGFSSSTNLGFGFSNRAMVRLNADRTLTLHANDAQIGSASPALTLTAWNRIELWWDHSPTAGSRVFRAYLDGVEWAGSSTLSTAMGGAQTFLLGGNLVDEAQTTGDWYFDDFAINDDSGSVQNGLPGDGHVINLFPNAAGDSNQWNITNNTGGGSNNYTLVDENPPDDGSSLVQSVTVNNQDLYSVAASGLTTTDTVNCVQVYARHRNNTIDATTSYALVIEKTSGGTKAQGASIVPGTTTWRTGSGTGSTVAPWPSLTAHTDPDGAAWTSTTLDSMQVGPKLVAAGTNRVQVSTVWVVVDYAPASSVDDTASPAAVATSVSLPAATVAAGSVASPAAVAGVSALPAATVQAGSVASPAVLGTGVAFPAATVSATGGPLSALVDDFDDDSIDTARWPNNYGGVAESGGRFVIDCDSGQWSGLKSAAAYTLDGSFVLLRAYPPAANTATVSYLSVLVTTTVAGTDAGFNIDTASGGIAFMSRVGFSDPDAVFDTYSPTDHAWLRLRESGGTLYWETSPDGQAWTVRRTDDSPTWVGDGDLALVVESHRDAGTDNTAEVDNVNTVSAVASPAALATAASLPALAAGGGASTTPAALSTSADLPAASTAAGSSASPAVLASTAALPAPDVSAGAAVTPAGVASTTALPQAAVQAGAAAAPATVTSSAVLPPPAVTAAAATTPNPVASVTALPAAAASAGSTTTPAPVTSTAALPAAAPTAASSATPATVATAATLPAATASGSDSGTATPAVLATAAAVPVASPSAASTASPAGVATTAALPAASVTGGVTGTASPETVTTTAALAAAAARAGARATPDPVASTAALPGAAVTAGASASPTPVTTTAGLPATTVRVHTTTTPATLTVVSVLPAATAAGGTGATAQPQPVAALATVLAAAVSGGVTAQPATLATAGSIPQAGVTTPGSIVRPPDEGVITRPSTGTITRPDVGLIYQP